jgi:hypothetical protein
VQDQISLPYVLLNHNIEYNVIDRIITDNEYTSYSWRADSNLGRWDEFYKTLPPEPSAFYYGDTETYRIGAEFLYGCETIEDWGTGGGGFKRYCPEAIGIDGSHTPFADKIADLSVYTSDVDGIFMRHVLEHNIDWKDILENALKSARKKVCVVLFTSPTALNTIEIPEGTEANKSCGVNVPNLRLGRKELINIFINEGCSVVEQNFQTDTEYGEETILLITKG